MVSAGCGVGLRDGKRSDVCATSAKMSGKIGERAREPCSVAWEVLSPSTPSTRSPSKPSTRPSHPPKHGPVLELLGRTQQHGAVLSLRSAIGRAFIEFSRDSPARARSFTHSPSAWLVTHSLTHSLTRCLLTHSLTHSLTRCLPTSISRRFSSAVL